MEDLELYLGLFPMFVGVLLMGYGIFNIFMHQRQKMLAGFYTGSFLMTTPVIFFTLSNMTVEPLLWGFFVAAICWLFFSLVYATVNSHCYEVMTREEILTHLKGGMKVSKDDVEGSLYGIWVTWDRSHSDSANFKYRLVEIYEPQHYTGCYKGEVYQYYNLERDFETVKAAKKYYKSIESSTVKVV